MKKRKDSNMIHVSHARDMQAHDRPKAYSLTSACALHAHTHTTTNKPTPLWTLQGPATAPEASNG